MIPSRYFWLVLVTAVFLLTFELGRMDVWSDNEGQRAVPPVEMMASGDYVVPMLNGEPYIVKPALLYWLIAGVYTVTGEVSALTARIPTAICGLLLTLALFAWARPSAGKAGAMWAAVGLIGSFYFLERARWAMLDVPLALGVFGAIVFWRYSTGAGGPRAIAWLAIAGLSFAAALMFKGPPAFIFMWAAWVASAHAPAEGEGQSPGRWVWAVSAAAIGVEAILFYSGIVLPMPVTLIVVIGAWSISAIRCAPMPAAKTFGLLAAVMGIGVLLAAPWAIALVRELTWEAIQAMLDEQVVERTYKASEINSGSPFFYLVILPALCAPFGILFLLQANPKFWIGAPSDIRFAGILGWVSILAFSLIAGKESEYILPAFPFLLAAMGWRFSSAIAGAREVPNLVIYRIWQFGLAAIVVLVAVGVTVAAVLLGHSALIVEAAVLGGCAIVLTVLAIRNEKARRAAFVVAAYVCILASVYAYRGFDYTGAKSPKALGEAAGAYFEAGVNVEVHRLYPALTFYAGRPVPVAANPRLARDRVDGDAPYAYIVHEDDRDRFLERLEREPKFVSAPYTSKGLTLVSNRPLPESARELIAPYESINSE